MNAGRIVDPFKVSKVAIKMLTLMEEEGLNQAEAEAMPQCLKNKIEENRERIDKCKPFTVFKAGY